MEAIFPLPELKQNQHAYHLSSNSTILVISTQNKAPLSWDFESDLIIFPYTIVYSCAKKDCVVYYGWRADQDIIKYYKNIVPSS